MKGKCILFNIIAIVYTLCCGAANSYAQYLELDWAKSLVSIYPPNMSTSTQVEPAAMKKAANGDIIIAGKFTGTVDFDPAPDTTYIHALTGAMGGITLISEDVFIARYTQTGALLWVKRFGSYDSYTTVNDIAIDNSGNVFATGIFSATTYFNETQTTSLATTGSTDAYIAKLDASGNLLWVNKIAGTGSDGGTALACDNSGNLYAAGYYSATLTHPVNATVAGGTDFYIARYNANGQLSWLKTIGGSSDDMPNSMAIDATGNLLITGYFSGTVDFDPGTGVQELSSAGGKDVFLFKWNSSGNFIWAKQVGGTEDDEATVIQTDPSGNIYYAGIFKGTAKFNTNPSLATPVFSTANNNTANTDGFISKLTANGDLVWAGQIGGAQEDVIHDLVIDSAGLIHTTGFFKGRADFDPGSNTYNLSAYSSWDMFLASFNNDGTLSKAFNIGGTSKGIALTLANSGVYVCGLFRSLGTDFDPGPKTLYLYGNSGTSLFFQKYYSCKPAGLSAITGPDSVCVNGSYTYTVEPVSGTSFYKWQLPEDWMGNSTTNSITINKPLRKGEISVSVDGFCEEGSTQVKTVNLLFEPLNITLSGKRLRTTPNNFETWQWYKDGKPIPGATESTYLADTTGIYSVIVTGKGCTDSAFYELGVSTSIDDAVGQPLAGLHIFPNPVKDILYIKSPVKVNVGLSDIAGHKVLIKADSESLDIRHLPAGTYLLQFWDNENRFLGVQKIIKQ